MDKSLGHKSWHLLLSDLWKRKTLSEDGKETQSKQ